MNPLGFMAGLATAAFWTATSICFEEASRRIGSVVVNILRLAFALALYVVLSLVTTGSPVTTGASAEAWLYLSLSGLVGFVLGDLLLFRSFVLIGARLSMLIFASSPIITAVVGFLFLGERMKPLALAGMFLAVGGIALAILGKPKADSGDVATPPGPEASRAGRQGRWAGIFMAFGGSVGQSVGLILSKRGAVGLDSFAASEIRVISGLAGFALIILLSGKTKDVFRPFALAFPRRSGTTAIAGGKPSAFYRGALGFTTLGATMGPFLGVSLGLLSAQLLSAAIASTLMAVVPVLIIPVAVLAFREKVSALEIAGAVVTVGGVALLAF